MKNKTIEKTVEVICEKGCRSVREDIIRLQDGQSLSETDGLSSQQTSQVLQELITIMSVYGDTCRTDGKLGVRVSHEIEDELEVI